MPDPGRSRAARSALVLAAAVTLGCETGRGGGAVQTADFPSPEELARLEAAPLPEAVFASDLVDASEWSLGEPTPERISARPRVDRSPWGELLREVTDASDGRVVATEAMHCVARELARFAFERGGQPDDSIRRFIVGGCNASVARIGVGSLQAEVADETDEQQIFERWRTQVLSMLESQVESGQRLVVGVAFARGAGRAALYSVVGLRDVELEPVNMRVGSDGRFELRGRALGPAAFIEAMLNRGRYEVAVCEPVGELEPPAFHLACELDPADESASVTLLLTPPKRILGRVALHPLVWRRGADRTYRRFEYAKPRRIGADDEFAPAFVEELNGVRERAGLGPVILDVSESATATRVAPHFFAAATGTGEERVADVVALGLMAGWDVEGTVRKGRFAFGAIPQTDDVSTLLSAALEEPTSRAALLDPRIERLAVGPIVGEADGIPMLAAVLGGYVMFDEATHPDDAELVFAQLAAARRERELPPPYRLVNLWMQAMGAAADVGRGEEPKYAMDDLLQQSVGSLSAGVQGWYAETSELDALEFPEEYLSAPGLGAAIGVSHRKEPGDAWGRYVVMIVAATH